MKAILGTKGKQTQQFTETGKRIPVTVVSAGPCWVTRITDMGDYQNVQLAFGNAKHIAKAQKGHMKKAGLEENKPRFLREIRVEKGEEVKVGAQVGVADVFAVGDTIRVTGISKGRGFAGGVRRYGFKGGPRTHGQSDRERAPGSIGMTTTPGRVFKGKRMAGRLGNDTVTTGRLKVVAVDAEKNLLTISGLIPGATDALVVVQKAK